MKKTRELKGMAVLALQEGERLGQVRDFILDPVARQIVALILDRRVGGEDQVIATANVRSVGPAAITVENRGSLVQLSRIPRFQELARVGKPFQGKMVISETGVRLGQVDDLEINVETFQLVSLVLKGFLRRGPVISTDLVRTIGTDAIVVCAGPAAGAVGGSLPYPAPEAAPAPRPFTDQESAPPYSAPAVPVVEPTPDFEPAPALEQEPSAEAGAPPLEEPTLFPYAEPYAPPLEDDGPPLFPDAVPVEEAPPPAEDDGPPLFPDALPAEAPPPLAVAPPEEEPSPDVDAAPLEGEVLPLAPEEEEEENAWQRWVRRLKRGD